MGHCDMPALYDCRQLLQYITEHLEHHGPFDKYNIWSVLQSNYTFKNPKFKKII